MTARWLWRAFFVIISLPAASSVCVAEEEEQEKRIKQVVEPFLKALTDKEIDAAMKYADVPWLTDNEKIIKDRDELKKHLQEKMKSFDAKRWQGKINAVATIDDIKRNDDTKKFRDTVDKVLNTKDQFVILANDAPLAMFWFLVRKQKDTVSLAGGPYRMTYLLVDNTIPDDANAILEHAEQIALYSLKPEGLSKWNELGKTVVKDAETRKRLIAEFKTGVEESIGVGALCFNPRHMIKATYNGKSVEMVICFECMQVQVRLGDKEAKTIYIAQGPEAFFDKVLKDAGVELAPKRKEER
jgi:hypothetical protein